MDNHLRRSYRTERKAWEKLCDAPISNDLPRPFGVAAIRLLYGHDCHLYRIGVTIAEISNPCTILGMDFFFLCTVLVFHVFTAK